jgi:putative peptide zinc metalloprotease protein
VAPSRSIREAADPADIQGSKEPKERTAVRRTKRVCAAILTATLSTIPASAFAGAGVEPRANNIVPVVNMNGGEDVRDSVAVATNPAPRVANVNSATAFASCVDCRTVVVAVQILLIGTHVTDFQPANSAVAVNYLCTRCATFAYASQVVVSAPDEFRVGQAAMQQLDTIGDEIGAAARSHVAFDQLSAQLDALVDELCTVVNAELTSAGAAPSCFRTTATQQPA